MASPMHNAYCTTPTGDAYCRMPTSAEIPVNPAAAHTQTAGLGNLDMTGITLILAFAAYTGKWAWLRRQT